MASKTLRIRIIKSEEITFQQFKEHQQTVHSHHYDTEEAYQADILKLWNQILTRSNGVIETTMELHDDDIEYVLADEEYELDEEECECGEPATDNLLVGGTDEGNVYQKWCKDCLKTLDDEQAAH